MPALQPASPDVPRALSREAQALVAEHATLERVVRWSLSQTPPQLVIDVVKQDEFTQDVVVAFRDGYYLVYDST